MTYFTQKFFAIYNYEYSLFAYLYIHNDIIKISILYSSKFVQIRIW